MRIDNLHPRSNLNIERHHFIFKHRRFREHQFYEKDGVPWDSMVGVRAKGK